MHALFRDRDFAGHCEHHEVLEAEARAFCDRNCHNSHADLVHQLLEAMSDLRLSLARRESALVAVADFMDEVDRQAPDGEIDSQIQAEFDRALIMGGLLRRGGELPFEETEIPF